MKLGFPSPEFDDAVAAVCHGSATEAEMQALNELLRSDSRARDEYLMQVELHARLASNPEFFACAAVGNTAFPEPEIQPNLEHKDAIPNNLTTLPSRRIVAKALALAACIGLLAAGIWKLWFWQSGDKAGITSTAVAMLSRVVDVQWSPGGKLFREGSALEPGWLQLESGLAQVIFYSGARVVIEGPAKFRLVTQNEADCPTGRLLVEVPPPAQGFRLKTENIEVVDMGTRFGIHATHSRTEVHVFNGKVEVGSKTIPKQILHEGEAAVVAGNTPPQRMAAMAAAFSSLFDFQERSLAYEALRYEQWQVANAILNQDPSLLVHLEFQELNDGNWTLRNSAEHNRSVEDATIVGCQRAEGRWREKQALEFHTVNDRVRLMIPGEFDALTISVWVCVKGLDRKLNSLVMCDGFEPCTIHWLIRNDGILGLTVFGTNAGNLQIAATPPVLTLDRLGTWLHLVVVLDGRSRQVIHYVNGTPVGRETLKIGPPYRLGSAELGNWNAKSGPNPAPNLIRNLSGAMDEFELFNRALTDAEVHELYVKGRPN